MSRYLIVKSKDTPCSLNTLVNSWSSKVPRGTRNLTSSIFASWSPPEMVVTYLRMSACRFSHVRLCADSSSSSSTTGSVSGTKKRISRRCSSFLRSTSGCVNSSTISSFCADTWALDTSDSVTSRSRFDPTLKTSSSPCISSCPKFFPWTSVFIFFISVFIVLVAYSAIDFSAAESKPSNRTTEPSDWDTRSWNDLPMRPHSIPSTSSCFTSTFLSLSLPSKRMPELERVRFPFAPCPECPPSLTSNATILSLQHYSSTNFRLLFNHARGQ
mmetsp:Transcript_64558/g.154005  ORF Transcript_64558/g.154005 Transcript_64558/m.154005 type:complete len:271 (+) Transcript_64558:855-1667(+)